MLLTRVRVILSKDREDLELIWMDSRNGNY